MKKFIEALKEEGIYDHIVETIVDVRSKHGAEDVTEQIIMILKMEMIRNLKLFNIFDDDVIYSGFKTVAAEIMKSVVDVEKVDAMKDVNPDERFEKATEHDDSGLEKSDEEALEDAVGSFIDFINEIENMLNN